MRKPWRSMRQGIHQCSSRKKSSGGRYWWRIWGWSWWGPWWRRGPPWLALPPGLARRRPTRWPRWGRREYKSVWGSSPSTSQTGSRRPGGNSCLNTGTVETTQVIITHQGNVGLRLIHTLSSNKVSGKNQNCEFIDVATRNGYKVEYWLLLDRYNGTPPFQLAIVTIHLKHLSSASQNFGKESWVELALAPTSRWQVEVAWRAADAGLVAQLSLGANLWTSSPLSFFAYGRAPENGWSIL